MNGIKLSTAKKLVAIRLFISAWLLDFDDTLGKTEWRAFTACCTLINEVLRYFKVEFQFTVAELLSTFRGRSFHDMIIELGMKFGFLIIKNPDGLDVSEEMLQRFAGKSFKDMVKELGAGYVYTIREVTLEDGRVLDLAGLVTEEMARVIALFEVELEPTDGVNEVLAFLSQHFELNIVSSSAWERLLASLKGTAQRRYFEPVTEHVYSATTHLVIPGKGAGKPAPDIYLHAAKMRGLECNQCAGVEDSGGGMDSLVAAGVLVKLGYVGIFAPEDRERRAEDLRRRGADGIIYNWTAEEVIDVTYGALVRLGKIQ